MSDLFDMANELEELIERSSPFDLQADATLAATVTSLRTMADLLVDMRAVIDHYYPDPDLPDPGDIIRQGAEACRADPDFEDRVLGSLGWGKGQDSVVGATLAEMVRTLTEGAES